MSDVKQKNSVKRPRKQDAEGNYIFNRRWEPLLYLIPFALGLLVFTVYPIVNVVLMSIREGYSLSGRYNGVGLANYTQVINDTHFKTAIGNTFIYVFTVVPIATVLAIIIANLLNQKIRGMAIFQTAYFLPMVTSSIAVGMSWRYLFKADSGGVINWLIGLFGAEPVNWLGAAQGKAPWNIFVIIIFGIWNMLPFTIILLLSGLQNIDPMYYTAARVDGANSSKMFFRITVPLLAPTIFLTMIINMISAFKVYNEVIPFWSGKAGALGSNLYTMVYYIKETFYSNRKLGKAAAASLILFFIIFLFTMLQRYIQKRFRD
ncbi:MAG: sugar ABC transporter permease [Lachnospiraceae bacterium]|nr:sugar ABC transporter permease [Lachnospiraceae bacterium]